MPGDATGPLGSQPIAQSGGLSFLAGGAPVGLARSTINLLSGYGVASRGADDATPSSEKADVGFDVSAYKLLVPPITGLDLVAGVGTTVLIPALAGTRQQIVKRLVFVPELVDAAPAVQPIVEAQQGSGAIVAFSAALQCTDVNVHDFTQQMGDRIPVMSLANAPDNVLNLVQTGLATAASYRVTVLVYGFILVP